MEVARKLEILADAAKYDASCASSGAVRKAAPGGLGNSTGIGICHSYTPDGRCVSLLKILLTNYCVYDCVFCVNRISSDTPRARFTAQEVISLTLEFYRRNYIEGLFLSSGIIQSPDYTMEQLVTVARALRREHKFNGYIHLKVIPGASLELLQAAGTWADRLSANVELPTQVDLSKLAPEKKLVTIRNTMDAIKSSVDEARGAKSSARTSAMLALRTRRPLQAARNFAPAGQSTQLVVGATATNDTTILNLAADLYGKHQLRRIYYSAFSPFPRADSRLPLQAPPLVREHRLYQADWLMRYYGFGANELTTPAQPDLDLNLDPKLKWALRNRHRFPVDINRGTREELLRIPGIGYRTVGRILSIRRYHRLRLEDLKKLRVFVNRAKAFLCAADHHPGQSQLESASFEQTLLAAPRQLALFGAGAAALTGEL
jgi:putative DNA modification/repair radical SAM protein